jgi:hypothetical protein
MTRITCTNKSEVKAMHLRSSMASLSVRFGVESRKLSNVGQSLDGRPKILLSQAPLYFGRVVKSLVPAALQSLAPICPRPACNR